ncbi:uncharacterized protein LOC144914974 [Branchiostoma floridae x Branchiostoma belcheri]
MARRAIVTEKNAKSHQLWPVWYSCPVLVPWRLPLLSVSAAHLAIILTLAVVDFPPCALVIASGPAPGEAPDKVLSPRQLSPELDCPATGLMELAGPRQVLSPRQLSPEPRQVLSPRQLSPELDCPATGLMELAGPRQVLSPRQLSPELDCPATGLMKLSGPRQVLSPRKLDCPAAGLTLLMLLEAQQVH